MIDRYISLLRMCLRIRSIKYIIARLLELFMGYPIYILSFLFPRKYNKWLFGTNVGFIDNAKYLFIYINENHKEILPIWITPSNDDVEHIRNLGFRVCKKYSLIGLWHSLTAHVYIFTYHSKDINFFTSGGAKKINLWHGVGIKGGKGGKLGNNFASNSNSNLLLKLLFPYIYEKNSLFVSTSDMMDKHFSKMFSLSHECIFDAIYPRCYYMCKGKDYMKKFIKTYEGEDVCKMIDDFAKYQKIFIYMPTWRGNLNDDFLKDAGFDFDHLNNVMRCMNRLFILKLHPAVRIEKCLHYNKYSNLIFLDKKIDIYPILPFVDVLITDYSSIYYDFLLLNKGVILYPFDKDLFLNYSNDFAFDYDDNMPGFRVMSMMDLEKALMSDNLFEVEYRDVVLENFWGKVEFDNLEKLCNKISSL